MANVGLRYKPRTDLEHHFNPHDRAYFNSKFDIQVNALKS